MLVQNNSLFLERGLNQSIILRKNIRVKSSKLPVDFFDSTNLSRYTPSKRSVKKSMCEENTRETYTPCFQRLQEVSPVLSKGQRKIGTARVNMNKDKELINDVINTTRSIRRVFRRKSLEMMRQSYQRQETELQLPKIKNPRKGSQFF